MTCFTCQREGHIAADCTWKRELRPRATPQPPPVPERSEGKPPTPGYLEARDRLGIPSTGPNLLELACAWCGSGAWQRCVNSATGQPKTQPHDARYEAAGLVSPVDREQAAIAREQAEQSRRSRLAS